MDFSALLARQDGGGLSLTDLINALPKCALDCILTAAGNSTCALTDNDCRCADTAYQAQASACILGACTVRESLATRNLTTIACNIKPYVNHSAKPVYLTMTILSGIFVALRFVARGRATVKVWWDDFCTLASLSGLIALTVIIMKLYDMGMGTDFWTIPQSNIDKIFQFWYVALFLYGITRTLSRISILLFYFRIFERTPGHKLRVGILIFDVVTCGALILLTLFPCTPISVFWTRWDGVRTGKCVDFKKEVLGIGIKDIFVDVIIITLPLPYIASLNLDRKKKILSMLLFSFGLCVIGTGIAKLTVVDKFVNSRNPTVDMLDLALISVLELDLGIICACLPSIKPLLTSRNVPFLKHLKSTKMGSYLGGSGTSSSGGTQKIHVTYSTTVASQSAGDEGLLIGQPDTDANGMALTNMNSRGEVQRGPQYASDWSCAGSQNENANETIQRPGTALTRD
ncbi:hypothetical protein QBC38DRAFT_464691 [Podospora fimiseda]|uniref:CFEM domain-containing protein n=1 Tax=Podospora fimiseda TaxID=252190 RepID=A0AAN7BY71_9PEZI|nr:hypothetical protein QBC38DRAFT_464691 [Podospora fimiseda]